MSTPPLHPDAPLPDDVARELDRVRARWSVLAADRANAAAPAVRAVVDDLARRATGATPGPLPARVLPDALAVVVRDAYLAGCADDVPAALTALRRALP